MHAATTLMYLAATNAFLRVPLRPPQPPFAAAATHARVSAPAEMLAKLRSPTLEFDSLNDADHSPVGVLLLSVGAPETPEDVEEYLYNVFSDPEIRTLPPILSWAFKKPLAWLIAKDRAEEAKTSMRQAGGRSPQLSTIQAQAKAIEEELIDRGVSARTFIAMRYWHPYTEEAVESIKAEGIQKLVILPLYPQFSLSTSGSALRVLERLLYTDPGFPMKSSVVPAWYNRAGFLSATAKGIKDTISTLPAAVQGKAHLLYTAQGLPRKYVETLGDPYQEQVERCLRMVTQELESIGVTNPHSLAYQGAFGPTQLRWLEPSTSDEITRLASPSGSDEGPVEALVLVPISFVFEHMGARTHIRITHATLSCVGPRPSERLPGCSWPRDHLFVCLLSVWQRRSTKWIGSLARWQGGQAFSTLRACPPWVRTRPLSTLWRRS